jgi:hypothetical protein
MAALAFRETARYFARVIATSFKYRGRIFTAEDVARLEELIAANPTAHRRRLSMLACEMLDWRQANGQPRDMLCRSAMLALHRAGRITLPPPTRSSMNNAIRHRSIAPILLDAVPLESSLKDLGPIEVRQVRRTQDERLVDGLIQAYHYLGYTRPVGECLKYLFLAQGSPIACAAWSSAPRHLGPRDRFIGWSKEARRRNVHLLAYNTRFLILPWVRVPHLASHLLGRMARSIRTEWKQAFGHEVVYLESFTDPSRFRGTCYRAANWVFLGRTKGRGNNAPTMAQRVPIKEILGLPLDRRFRDVLGSEA